MPGRHRHLPHDGCSHAKLIARADAAMYASKRSGGSKFCFYSSAMDADAEAQFERCKGDPRKAAGAGEFELFYPPKSDSKSGKVTAVEALLRWKHPTRGLLLPSTSSDRRTLRPDQHDR